MRSSKPRIIKQLLGKEVSLWGVEPSQYSVIENRLGWLDADKWMQDHVESICDWVADTIELPWLERIVLLGMGGSSLAPEVFSSVFPPKPGYPVLQVIDTTCPEQIKEAEGDLSRTLVIVSSKSGGTRETADLCSYFFQKMEGLVDSPEDHFVVITDMGSQLHEKAKKANFRKIFTNPTNIGGRYSALSYFGLVPAGLIGVDIKRLSNRVSEFCEEIRWSGEEVSTENIHHDAVKLGMIMGNAAKRGCNIMTLQTATSFRPLLVWIEQLIAESTGKMGKGIVPAFEYQPPKSLQGENQDSPGELSMRMEMIAGNDQNASLLDNGASVNSAACGELGTSLTWKLEDVYDLGAEFFRWEIATAVASIYLAINPFDEPNVSEAKSSTDLFINGKQKFEYRIDYEDAHYDVFLQGGTNDQVDSSLSGFANIYSHFLNNAVHHSYIGVLAYLPFSEQLDEKIKLLGNVLSEQSGLPVTLGYGPRYLHSTGQLHKGGPKSCSFIQLIDNATFDLDIPGRDYTFRELNRAQADGDFAVLESKGRSVMRISLKVDRLSGLDQLISTISNEA
ncbi:MAG: hypothetical protein GKR96_03215 [Gammaproteobacteria bacterium]|nr:hypothetical protein [Gammaproteobacteria bacterium]